MRRAGVRLRQWWWHRFEGRRQGTSGPPPLPQPHPGAAHRRPGPDWCTAGSSTRGWPPGHGRAALPVERVGPPTTAMRMLVAAGRGQPDEEDDQDGKHDEEEQERPVAGHPLELSGRKGERGHMPATRRRRENATALALSAKARIAIRGT